MQQATTNDTTPPTGTTATHCTYCAFQCGMRISIAGNGGTVAGNGVTMGNEATITGDADFPVNKGALCIKGWTAAATLSHPERLTTPLARDASGALVRVSWDERWGGSRRGSRMRRRHTARTLPASSAGDR